MIIKWSKDAINDYNEIIDYLKKKWSIREIKNFNLALEKAKSNIIFDPETFPCLEKYPHIRKYKLTKQVSILYIIKKNIIYILFLWNEYRNPKYLKELLSSSF